MPELKSSIPSKPKVGIMIGKRASKGIIGKIKSVSKESIPKPVVVQSEKTKVLEAFLEKDEENSNKLRLGLNDEDIQPIGYELRKEDPAPKERIGDTSVNKILKRIGPEIPEHVRQTLSTESDVDKENSSVTKAVGTLDVLKNISSDDQTNKDKDAEDCDEKQKKRGDRGWKRKVKTAEDDEEEYYKIGMDSKYDVWVPPQNQSGDGKTSLNEKLGY